MKPGAIVFVDLVGAAILLVIYALLRRRQLSIGLAAWWVAIVGGLMLAVTVSPIRQIWFAVSVSLFQSPPFVIALTLVLIVFLLYISVVISVVQRQIREIAQAIALAPDSSEPTRSNK